MYRHTGSPDNGRTVQNFWVFDHHLFCSHQRPQSAIYLLPKIGKTNRQKVAFAGVVFPLLPRMVVGHRIANCLETSTSS